VAKNPTPAQIAALKKSKGVKSTAKVGNVTPGAKKSMANQAAMKKAFTPDGKDKVQNFLRGAVLTGGLARAAGTAIQGAAGRAGEAAARQALAKAAPSTSKTMNVLKGSKVITSGKTGVANATSNVAKVTLQKSGAKSAAGRASYAARQGTKEANKVIKTGTDRAKGFVDGATVVTGGYSLKKPKKK
jgi:hypothetical protein